MKKLVILASCLASTIALAAPSSPTATAPFSSPFTKAPKFLIVHNKIHHVSVASRDGKDSQPALPETTSKFPWQTEVVPFCAGANPCNVDIMVLKGSQRINAGSLSFNVKNGKITIIPGDKHYQITVNGIGEATLKHAHQDA